MLVHTIWFKPLPPQKKVPTCGTPKQRQSILSRSPADWLKAVLDQCDEKSRLGSLAAAQSISTKLREMAMVCEATLWKVRRLKQASARRRDKEELDALRSKVAHLEWALQCWEWWWREFEPTATGETFMEADADEQRKEATPGLVLECLAANILAAATAAATTS